MTKAYYSILSDRSGIMVTGEDAKAFLQSLITQDMEKLESQEVIYSALLTPQGKMDYDFFIYKQDDGYLIETELERVEALCKRLQMFIMRRKVSVNIEPIQVVVAWGDIASPHMFQLIHDPRKKLNLFRRILKQDIVFDDKNEMTKANLKFYHGLCVENGLLNHSSDIAWGQDMVADLNLDALNGVSHDKGCYLGQELTSRMHHRNLGKKGLYGIEGEDLPQAFEDLRVGDALIGQMRSSVSGVEAGGTSQYRRGLAVLRHDGVEAAKNAGFKIYSFE